MQSRERAASPWLATMDRSAYTRKKQQDAAPPSHPPAPVETSRDKRPQSTKLRRPASGKIKLAKDSNEITRVPRKAPLARPSADDETTARHFTVGNVGPGGQLYLKPSRAPPQHFTQAPATPPDTSDGEYARTDWSARQSNNSGSWTPQLRAARIGTFDHAIPVPPLSLANTSQKRRPRSHSFSTASERVRTPAFDSNDFQLLVNGRDTESRPKSSVDLSAGLLDLHIP